MLLSTIGQAKSANVRGNLYRPAGPDSLYIWAALPFAVGAVMCFIIHRLNTARLAVRPELREAQ
jgi:hypothetical protein